jgi:hypothetical protein
MVDPLYPENPSATPALIHLAFPTRSFDGDGVGDNASDATMYPYNAVSPTPDLSPILFLTSQAKKRFQIFVPTQVTRGRDDANTRKC